MWTVISCVLSAAIALACASVSVFAALRASRASELPQGKLRSVESRLASIEGSLPEMQTAMEVVANRVKMQRVRTAATHAAGSTGEPDPRQDPEGWRTWKNAQLHAARFNQGAS